MWKEILDDNDLAAFLKSVCYFHDSCIKEMKYSSGAYVDEELSMYPINDKRTLKVIIQRQFQDTPVVELEFEGLKYLKLFPVDEKYTCEILDASMAFINGDIYWCDSDNIMEADLDNYEGTIICASKLRWRSLDNCLGQDEFYSTGDKGAVRLSPSETP